MITQSVLSIPEDYKLTDAGVIPKGWDAKRLGDLGECLIGLTYKPENVREYGALVLRSSNIADGRLAFDDNVYVECDIPERIKVKEGDILICVRNGSRALIGKCALLNKQVEGQTFGAFMSVFRTADSEYIFHQFQSDNIQRQIHENIGATINQITNKSLNSFVVPYPADSNERDAIAECLSEVDALIASLEKLIAKKRAIKQGAMQELLSGKRRLAGFSGEWKVKCLGEICSPSKERLVPAQSLKSYKCVELEHIESVSGRLLGYVDSKQQLSQKTFFRRGDVLFGKLRPYLKKYWYAEFDGVCSTEIWVLKVQKPIVSQFLYYLMQTHSILEAAKQSTGTKMPRAEWKTLEKLELILPSTDGEQTAIAEMLSSMDSETLMIEQQIEKYRCIKLGMTQVLLTGKVRIV